MSLFSSAFKYIGFPLYKASKKAQYLTRYTQVFRVWNILQYPLQEIICKEVPLYSIYKILIHSLIIVLLLLLLVVT